MCQFLLLYIPLLCLMISLAPAQDSSTDLAPAPAAEVQQKVREWVHVRQLISEEQAQWQAEKEQLSALNSLRARESAQLDEYIAAAGKRVEEADAERQQLITDEESLRAQRKLIEQKIIELETELRQQIGRYPAPLRNSISEAIARLENPDSATPLQDRWRDLLIILGETTRFQNKITIDTEIREIEGKRVEVDVMYSGLSQAWYVDRTRKYAGIGTATADGWQWTPDNSIANDLDDAIAISRKKKSPDYISLPFTGAAK